MGGVNSDYSTEFTLVELLLALNSCKGSSPGPDNKYYIYRTANSSSGSPNTFGALHFRGIHNAFDMTWRHGILTKLYAHDFRVSTCFYEKPSPSWLYCPDSYPTPHGVVIRIPSLPDAIAAVPAGTPLPLHALPWVLRSYSDSCDSACSA
ncbi:hypothetical protein E2C01_050775 [Portunus trituberculatus]|uniref:Uncharacterized protein n=1 Tax=Portunus trituberculatus TaxID=210409 RepID=A0A5B7G974_PORTR|nr:hypothetical protein [Portunus trituberculatus]